MAVLLLYETVAQQFSVTRLDTAPPTAGDGKRKIPAAETFRKAEISPLTRQKVLRICQACLLLRNSVRIFLFVFKEVLIYHSLWPKNGFKFDSRELLSE